jgi:7-carboxy-7-deazaguanine synthase
VSLETSGALDISQVDARVVRVVDIKTPGSGESRRNLLANLDELRATDVVKFVVCDRADFDWSRALVVEHGLAHRCQVFFSPSHQQVPARELADWILADHAPVRLQVQLHKYLWGDVRGK